MRYREMVKNSSKLLRKRLIFQLVSTIIFNIILLYCTDHNERKRKPELN